MKNSRRKKNPRRVLRLPDLDYAKGAVLNTLGSPASKRAYEFAIDDFVNWYCSEPRLAFSKRVVLRYRIELESRHLAPATINLRLAAVRRLAFEAADTGLLSPELAAGIRRVKGAKRVGVRLENWLTAEQSRASRRPTAEGSPRPGNAGIDARLRSAPGRGCGPPTRSSSTAGGPFGDCRLGWQGRAHPYGPRAGLGEGCG